MKKTIFTSLLFSLVISIVGCNNNLNSNDTSNNSSDICSENVSNNISDVDSSNYNSSNDENLSSGSVESMDKIEEKIPMTEYINYNNFKLSGYAGTQFDKNYENWLAIALDENPAMLEVFYKRENLSLVPWFGEFVGKYLVSLCYYYEMNNDEKINENITAIIKFLQEISDDGYLGPYSKENRLIGYVGANPENDKIWDVWGNYHIVMGLIKCYELEKNNEALQLAQDALDYIIDFFKIHDYEEMGAPEMNLSITHAYVKFYNLTKQEKYLDEALHLLNNYWPDFGGNWYNNALNGIQYYQSSLPRWEALHAILALPELYKATKNESYLSAAIQIWNSIYKYDIHNAGSFTSNETATGDPYADNNIETCCTIAWMEFSVELLKLTNNPLIAEQLELSQLNAVYGSQLELDPNQNNIQYYTYDTPMNGSKQGAVKTLIWQSIGRAADVSCCQLNGPKGPSMIGQWGFYENNNEYYLNYYGASSVEFYGGDYYCRLTQKNDYYVDGKIVIDVKMTKSSPMKLKLRIPSYSTNTIVKVNSKEVDNVVSGEYLLLDRVFNDKDIIEIQLNYDLKVVLGGNGYKDCVSLYYGNILFAVDQKYNDFDIDELVLNDDCFKTFKIIEDDKHIIKAELMVNNQKVILIDYASSGKHNIVNEYGSYYRSWILYNK